MRTRQDEERRMAHLQSLSTEDLANKRITEYSSEREKQMIQQAREVMRERADDRYRQRYIEKSKIDLEKAKLNRRNQRLEYDVFGNKGFAGEGGAINETAGLFGLSGKSTAGLVIGSSGLIGGAILGRRGLAKAAQEAAPAVEKVLSKNAQKTEKMKEKAAFFKAKKAMQDAEAGLAKEAGNAAPAAEKAVAENAQTIAKQVAEAVSKELRRAKKGERAERLARKKRRGDGGNPKPVVNETNDLNAEAVEEVLHKNVKDGSKLQNRKDRTASERRANVDAVKKKAPRK